MHLLIVLDLQTAIETDHTRLTEDAVIEEESILIGAHKTPDIDFPRIIHKRVILLARDAEVAVEADDHDIGCQSLRTHTGQAGAEISIKRGTGVRLRGKRQTDNAIALECFRRGRTGSTTGWRPGRSGSRRGRFACRRARARTGRCR